MLRLENFGISSFPQGQNISGCESPEGVSLWGAISLMWSTLVIPAISRERELNLGIVLREAGDGHLELSQEKQE